MQQLVLLRGAMGAGKDTFITEQGLEPYTLSSDTIRLMFEGPLMNDAGELTISQKNDHRVWDLLFDLLETRMKRGEFVVVNATHANSKTLARYKKLAQHYRYRTYAVDFSDVPLDVVLKQNKMRATYKHVPDAAVMTVHDQIQTTPLPNWITTLKPHEFREAITYSPTDYNKWQKIHHIGDIHGCYTALQQYLNSELHDDELYIFVGDYLDRGLENVEVLQFLLTVYEQPNVVLLRGNHEKSLEAWANDEEIRGGNFGPTKEQLEAANISKKDVRQLCRRLRQVVYYTYDNQEVLVTHAGIPKMPEDLHLMPTRQFVYGVGSYSLDVDHLWEQHETTYQVHGHRNLYHLPVQATPHTFNLEGQVEKGQYLRAMTLSKDGFETFEIKNDVYELSQDNTVTTIQEDVPENEFIAYLRAHELVQEKPMDGHISSFNFTRQAFTERAWDALNIKARGLFINTKNEKIVARSYNKFFNIGEREDTKMDTLAENLTFPVVAYSKENGFLGTVGYDEMSDALIYTSKSRIDGMHSEWVKELFEKQVQPQQREAVKRFLRDENVALVFEVIKIQEDPHIIDYDTDRLILLDIVRRSVAYEKLPYDEVVRFAETFALPVKQVMAEFADWLSFYEWYLRVTNDLTLEMEGYVLEDAAGFMTKLKLPFYTVWKELRTVKEVIERKQEVKRNRLTTPLHVAVYTWMKAQEQDVLKEMSILDVRKRYKK